jgi:hypothetical protein
LRALALSIWTLPAMVVIVMVAQLRSHFAGFM